MMRGAAETGAMITDEAGNAVMAPPEPTIDTEAVNAEFGIPGHLKFDKPTPRSVAQDLYEHKRDQILRQDIIDRREGGVFTGGATRFGANILAGAIDPLNLAVGFIPVLGEARIAMLLEQAGSAAARAGIRAGLGGAQGAVGMAALQPLEFALSRGEREDYTMADALRSIAVGAALGGGLHAGIGAAIDRVTGKYRNPISQLLEDSGPEVRQGLLRGALAQTIDGRPVNLEPSLDLADALRLRETPPGAAAARALPAAFEDPLVLMRRGELTAERAAQIRDDLTSLSPGELVQARTRIGEHIDPEMWTVIADNLKKAEASRIGGLDVIADQLRYLSDTGAIRTVSEREAVAVISRALQAEAGRGGDIAALLDDAFRLRYGERGSTLRRAVAQKQQLLGMVQPAELAQPSPLRAAAISEGERPSPDIKASEAGMLIRNSSAEAPPGLQPLGDQVSMRQEPSAVQIRRDRPPSIFASVTEAPRFSDLPLGGIEETSNKKIVQASADSKALLEAARGHAAPLRARLEELTRDIPGAKVVGVRAKDAAGLAEKIAAKGRSPATISDYLGGRISADTPDSFNRVLDAGVRCGHRPRRIYIYSWWQRWLSRGPFAG
jgi:hypothetical protein